MFLISTSQFRKQLGTWEYSIVKQVTFKWSQVVSLPNRKGLYTCCWKQLWSEMKSPGQSEEDKSVLPSLWLPFLCFSNLFQNQKEVNHASMVTIHKFVMGPSSYFHIPQYSHKLEEISEFILIPKWFQSGICYVHMETARLVDVCPSRVGPSPLLHITEWERLGLYLTRILGTCTSVSKRTLMWRKLLQKWKGGPNWSLN